MMGKIELTKEANQNQFKISMQKVFFLAIQYNKIENN